jgi:hypothetical protein
MKEMASIEPQLLCLPNELLLHVFGSLQTVGDSFALSATCSRLNRLFKFGRNRINILQSIANVPKQPDYDLKTALSGTVFTQRRVQPPLNIDSNCAAIPLRMVLEKPKGLLLYLSCRLL